MNFLKLSGGIFSLAFGIWFLRYLIKNPTDPEKDINKHMLQGYIAAFGALILGIVLVYNELASLIK